MNNKYDGDMIRIDRLAEFTFQVQWNDKGKMITLDDISCGIHEALPEQPDEYGNSTDRPAFEKSDYWHIGRIIYFVNRPDEIRDIEIDNYCDNSSSM